MWLPFGDRQLGPSPLLSGPQGGWTTSVATYSSHLPPFPSQGKILIFQTTHYQNSVAPPKLHFFAGLIKSRYHFRSFTQDGYCCVGCCQFFTGQSEGKDVSAPEFLRHSGWKSLIHDTVIHELSLIHSNESLNPQALWVIAFSQSTECPLKVRILSRGSTNLVDILKDPRRRKRWETLTGKVGPRVLWRAGCLHGWSLWVSASCGLHGGTQKEGTSFLSKGASLQGCDWRNRWGRLLCLFWTLLLSCQWSIFHRERKKHLF